MLIFLSLCIQRATSQSYCQPNYTVGVTTGVYIKSVSLNSINTQGTSNDSSYHDYTNQYSTTLVIGSTYLFSLTGGTNSSNNYFTLFIDYNGDGDFFDTYENVYQFGPSNQPNQNYAYNITIPASVTPINTRMRVISAYQGSFDALHPCGGYQYGEAEDYTLVLSNTAPAAMANFSISDTVVCVGESINLVNTSMNETTLEWLIQDGNPSSASNVQNPTVTWSSSGIKTIQLIASNSTGSDTLTQTILVQEPPVPSTITALGNTSLCAGDSVILTGNFTNGIWSNSSTNTSVTVTSSGYYGVTNTNECGVSVSNLIQVSMNLIDTSITIGNASFLANATNATYQWLVCDSNYSTISGQTNQTFTPSQADSYYAVAVTQNGCTDTSACYSFVLTTAIENSEMNASLTLYPNPTEHYLTISGPINQTIVIQNTLGEIVFSKSISLSHLQESAVTIDISFLPKGVYHITSNSKTKLFSKQ